MAVNEKVHNYFTCDTSDLSDFYMRVIGAGGCEMIPEVPSSSFSHSGIFLGWEQNECSQNAQEMN